MSENNTIKPLTLTGVITALVEHLNMFAPQVRDFNHTFSDIDYSKDLILFKVSSLDYRYLNIDTYYADDSSTEVKAIDAVFTVQTRGSNSYDLGMKISNSFRSYKVIYSFNRLGVGINKVDNINFIPDNYNANIIQPLLQFNVNLNYNSIVDEIEYIDSTKVIVNSKEYFKID